MIRKGGKPGEDQPTTAEGGKRILGWDVTGKKKKRSARSREERKDRRREESAGRMKSR